MFTWSVPMPTICSNRMEFWNWIKLWNEKVEMSFSGLIPNRCRRTNGQFWFPNSECDPWSIRCRHVWSMCLDCNWDGMRPFLRWTLFAVVSFLCPIAIRMYCMCLHHIGMRSPALFPMIFVACNIVCHRSHHARNCRMPHYVHANRTICSLTLLTMTSNITEWDPLYVLPRCISILISFHFLCV